MNHAQAEPAAPHPAVPDRPGWAVVLAGGSGRRLGGVDKPALRVDGTSLLDIALAAVAPARTVVVGPPRVLGTGVLQTRENPPGGGPAAAVAAGVAAIHAADRAVHPAVDRAADRDGAHGDLVVVLAADLPGIDADTVALLTASVLIRRLSGAVLVDPTGRSQYLAGVWSLADLVQRCGSRPSWDGGRLSDLLDPLIGARVPVGRRASADVDTTADLVEWGVEPPGGTQRRQSE